MYTPHQMTYKESQSHNVNVSARIPDLRSVLRVPSEGQYVPTRFQGIRNLDIVLDTPTMGWKLISHFTLRWGNYSGPLRSFGSGTFRSSDCFPLHRNLSSRSFILDIHEPCVRAVKFQVSILEALFSDANNTSCRNLA